MSYICNPMRLDYRYQMVRPHHTEPDQLCRLHREAADPSMVLFKGNYYLFPSVSGGFWFSNNLSEWTYRPFSCKMPVHDYAPDVRPIGDYLYFSASSNQKNCSFYRTRDPLNEPFEEIKGTFPFWDPNLFSDDDGRLYFFWGCSNETPLYGVELDPETMKPRMDPIPLIFGQPTKLGYERNGEDHCGLPEQIPYLEGAWMTKHQGKYYLQYAQPGTQVNVYNDGVYVSESPLGPYHPAKNNPFSYCPGGFTRGAGHGSTMKDKQGRFWHTSTIGINQNHIFERRIGMWKAGFDRDGELYCDQRYPDWPVDIDSAPFSNPEWMLLSYRKSVTVSSGLEGEKVTNENIRDWWHAANANTPAWVEVDLGTICNIGAIQVNFADHEVYAALPVDADLCSNPFEERAIDMSCPVTRWYLEGSTDRISWQILADRRDTATDYPHDLAVMKHQTKSRFIRLTITEVPFHGIPAISGVRIFGRTSENKPRKKIPLVRRTGALDMDISWERENETGLNILWGYAPDKLYHSYLTYGETQQKIGALIEGQDVWVRLDAFNGGGITEGDSVRVPDIVENVVCRGETMI